MYKGISSKKDYKHNQRLKYLSNSEFEEQDRLLRKALDTEVDKINSSPYILTGPKLLKSGTTDRKALKTTV